MKLIAEHRNLQLKHNPTAMDLEASSSNTGRIQVSTGANMTRSSGSIFGLGNALAPEDADIKGCRLPSSKQVLRCMMWHINDGHNSNRSKRDAARIVLQRLTPFYQKANIPVISEKSL